MMEVWNALDATQRALFAIAVPATVLLVAEFVMLLVGLAQGGGADSVDDADTGGDLDGNIDADVDGDVDIDMDIDGDIDVAGDADGDIDMNVDADAGAHVRGESGLRWFTLLGVASLLAITGWAGLALIEAALPAVLAIGMALLLGIGAMYLCALALRGFRRLGERGNLLVTSAVGKFAEVYLPIPPRRSASGKVTLNMQGRFVELDAVTDAADALPTGARVVVTGVAEGGAVLVRAARPTGKDGV